MLVNDSFKWTFPHEYAAAKGKMCFLCGSTKNLTSEHIFPAWLLRRYDLWKERLPLVNGRSSTFEKLKIRACLECNRDHLGKQLEDKMSAATDKGYDAVEALDKQIVFLWVAKIYLALRFKELTMQAKPGKNAGGIWHPGQVERDYAPYTMLGAVRGTVEILNPVPYSVLIINLHENDPFLPYGFSHYDNIHHKTFAIQIGTVGIVVIFEDLGMNDRFYGSYLDEAAGRKLTFHQYIELYVGSAYRRSLLVENPVYRLLQLPTLPEITFVDTAYSSLESISWNPHRFAKNLQREFKVNHHRKDLKFAVNKQGAVRSLLFRDRDMRFYDDDGEKITYIPPIAKPRVRPFPNPMQQMYQIEKIIALRKMSVT